MSIQTMQIELENSLKMCNTDFERSMCKAIGGKEIREAAEAEYKKTGKLSPVSLAIAEQYGFRL